MEDSKREYSKEIEEITAEKNDLTSRLQKLSEG